MYRQFPNQNRISIVSKDFLKKPPVFSFIKVKPIRDLIQPELQPEKPPINYYQKNVKI